jgi:hypothetical protein
MGTGETATAPACEEKSRLLRVYSFATSDYNRAVQVLQRRLGTISKEEYQKLRAFTERSRELAEQTRLALERHSDEHDC